MRRLERLITSARRKSENEGVTSTTVGISDEECIQFFNDAQEHLFQELEQIDSSLFAREYTFNTVSNQEEYEIPRRIYLDQNIISVEFSYTGNPNYYEILPHFTFLERDTTTFGAQPSGYLVRDGKILLNPIPSTNNQAKIRVNYVEPLPTLDKRRAQTTSVTVSSGVISALTVDTTDFANYFPYNSAFSSSAILVEDYFSLVDVDGNILSHNIPIGSISESTGVVTLFATHVPDEGDEDNDGDLVGAYLLSGPNATTHAALPNLCEKYLINYAVYQLMKRDASPRSQEQLLEVQQHLTSITTSWEQMSEDIKEIPILDDQWL